MTRGGRGVGGFNSKYGVEVQVRGYEECEEGLSSNEERIKKKARRAFLFLTSD
jgi:hypothetical protein